MALRKFGCMHLVSETAKATEAEVVFRVAFDHTAIAEACGMLLTFRAEAAQGVVMEDCFRAHCRANLSVIYLPKKLTALGELR